MRVRSPRLLALSLALLAAGAVLGAVLEHDGQMWDNGTLLSVQPGDEVVLQTTVEGLTRADWQHVQTGLPPLLNHTYTAERSDAWWVVATSEAEIPVDGTVVLHGVVIHERTLPDGTAFVLLRVDRVVEPLLFG